MARSLEQIQQQIAKLQQQAEALRSKEVTGVISRIKVAIDHYGLTAEQLGFGSVPGATKPTQSKVQKEKTATRVKLSDGSGNSWSGMGKRPNWLREALAAGRSIDEFLTDKATVNVSTAQRPTKARKKRRPSTVVYRDDAGHSWTGRGPQPRWLKESLAAGKSLEDFKG
ncbi:H-NS family nucleoid-associated regulatory protein [Variovorax sp. YR216]|uniref:H-NS histone family protein n=1 Tax=Variovorax sp. YR216 TaxID=1882828 RepID=UPI0008990006|nr:H-NS family nucleoid-associated regulatory protein [Variovorax sp. YR216]SEB24481.1 DNA-binding protein H-NS [Variovorax sp. YR216]